MIIELIEEKTGFVFESYDLFSNPFLKGMIVKINNYVVKYRVSDVYIEVGQLPAPKVIVLLEKYSEDGRIRQ